MLTSKQRAYLRSKANTLNVITQIGKEGVSRSLVAQIDGALRAHELIKLHVLENSGLEAREACDELCAAVHADGVQCIGRKIVIFRQNPEKSAFELPR